MARWKDRWERLSDAGEALRALGRIGMLDPRHGVPSGRATRRWGPTPAAGYEAGARRAPQQAAVVDDDGVLSYAEVDALSNALAHALLDRGVGPGEAVAMLCRNSRWFVVAATAIAKTGATTLYLNTGFAGPQAKEVLAREGARAVIYDSDLAEVIEPHVGHLDLIVTDRPDDAGDDAASSGDPVPLARLLRDTPRTSPEPPGAPGPQVILTSGTTGTPKGARRPAPKGLVATMAMFTRIPWRADDIHFVVAPMFHALGNGGFLIGSQLGQTLVMRRRFDPEETLRAIDRHRVTGMTVVPVMLQRILELPDEVIDRYDTSSLRLVHSSGSALPGSLALRWMDRFGDNLYNLFASTEVALATVASPEDLRAAPGTAGRPVPGSVVRLYDDDGQPIDEPGVTGRIFVGSGLRFEGYTGGGGKESIDGLLSIGDVGHFDHEGRLFVGGRDDDMIVSGGENVYPREVEDLLADHPAIAEVAVLGVPDDEFGQRLKAYVALREGAKLSVDEVKAHVRANLASYKVPRDVEFVDELPRNPTGKILKRELGD